MEVRRSLRRRAEPQKKKRIWKTANVFSLLFFARSGRMTPKKTKRSVDGRKEWQYEPQLFIIFLGLSSLFTELSFIDRSIHRNVLNFVPLRLFISEVEQRIRNCLPIWRWNSTVDAHGLPAVRSDAGGELVGAASSEARIGRASFMLPEKTWGLSPSRFRSLAGLIQLWPALAIWRTARRRKTSASRRR